jgi:4-hydroxy-tetrahydrodipicolinate synthase
MLRGSFPPLVTPFRNGQVDYEAFKRLVQRQVQAGSDGIVVAGTTGEPTMLTLDERRELLRTAVRTANGALTVVAATGSHSHAEAALLTESAAADGAEAVLIVTPYFVKPPERALIAYFRDLANRTPLPMLIYHIPGRAGVTLSPAAVEQIAAKAGNLVGLKHASTDLAYLTELLIRLGRDFRVFVGQEDLSFPMLAIGAAGLMSAVGNIFPERVKALCDAMEGKDFARAREIHFELFEINQAVFFDTNPIPMKYMMVRLGLLDDDEHRLPLLPATAELRSRLDAVLERANV